MATEHLSDSEREELEALRREKAAREEAAAAAAERQELEQLREERERLAREAKQLQSQEEARRLMDPDEDLNMAPGQKITLVAVAVVFVIAVLYIVFAPK